jgi:transcriptional regulator with GAF, ATPase, and Fis domain
VIPRFTIALVPTPDWRTARRSLERAILTAALEETDGNVARAAGMLGLAEVTVRVAVRRHGLEGLTRAGRAARG